jgi:hypothetical protein
MLYVGKIHIYKGNFDSFYYNEWGESYEEFCCVGS